MMSESQAASSRLHLSGGQRQDLIGPDQVASLTLPALTQATPPTVYGQRASGTCPQIGVLYWPNPPFYGLEPRSYGLPAVPRYRSFEIWVSQLRRPGLGKPSNESGLALSAHIRPSIQPRISQPVLPKFRQVSSRQIDPRNPWQVSVTTPLIRLGLRGLGPCRQGAGWRPAGKQSARGY